MGNHLRLGDHCIKIGSGATPRGGKDSYLPIGPFSLIRSQNVYNEGFSRSGLAFISQEQADALRNAEVKSGDVLLNITGDSVARACQVAEDVLPARVNQHVAIIRPKPDEIDPQFLRYFLVSREMQEGMLALASAGATRPALTKGMIENFQIPALKITEQRAIAAVLSALDDKIELNRRMNATLEGMARALFADWFVHFGPTRAKMEGTEPYLAPEIWSLFPDRLDENGVPEGWEEKPLSSFFSILGGGTPKTKEPAYWGGNIPWYSVVDVPSGADVYVHDTEKKITDRGVQESSAKMVREGTTIISARGTVGKLAMAAQEMTFNQSCYGLQGVGDVGDCFTYLAAQHMVSRLQAMAHGSVFSTITRATFQSLNLAMPKSHVLEALENAALPIFEKIKANGKESRTLAQTRDLLLPKLMSGELRVREAEGIMEGVA